MAVLIAGMWRLSMVIDDMRRTPGSGFAGDICCFVECGVVSIEAIAR